jgi:hypothetical protein
MYAMFSFTKYFLCNQGYTQQGVGAVWLQLLRIRFKKKTDFVDTLILNVVRDLPFCRNQLLNSAEDTVFYNFETQGKTP